MDSQTSLFTFRLRLITITFLAAMLGGNVASHYVGLDLAFSPTSESGRRWMVQEGFSFFTMSARPIEEEQATLVF